MRTRSDQDVSKTEEDSASCVRCGISADSKAAETQHSTKELAGWTATAGVCFCNCRAR